MDEADIAHTVVSSGLLVVEVPQHDVGGATIKAGLGNQKDSSGVGIGPFTSTGIDYVAEISMDRVEDARNAINVGDKIEVKIISVDRKNRTLGVSIKAKDQAEEEAAVREHQSRESDVQPTTIGDLIKQQMDGGES